MLTFINENHNQRGTIETIKDTDFFIFLCLTHIHHRVNSTTDAIKHWAAFCVQQAAGMLTFINENHNQRGTTETIKDTDFFIFLCLTHKLLML